MCAETGVSLCKVRGSVKRPVGSCGKHTQHREEWLHCGELQLFTSDRYWSLFEPCEAKNPLYRGGVLHSQGWSEPERSTEAKSSSVERTLHPKGPLTFTMVRWLFTLHPEDQSKPKLKSGAVTPRLHHRRDDASSVNIWILYAKNWWKALKIFWECC